MTTIAFCGLGRMGVPMAGRLLDAGHDLIVWNRTPDVPATALVDGHSVGDLGPGGRAVARLGDQRSLLASLPEVTFFSRYGRTFAS